MQGKQVVGSVRSGRDAAAPQRPATGSIAHAAAARVAAHAAEFLPGCDATVAASSTVAKVTVSRHLTRPDPLSRCEQQSCGRLPFHRWSRSWLRKVKSLARAIATRLESGLGSLTELGAAAKPKGRPTPHKPTKLLSSGGSEFVLVRRRLFLSRFRQKILNDRNQLDPSRQIRALRRTARSCD